MKGITGNVKNVESYQIKAGLQVAIEQCNTRHFQGRKHKRTRYMMENGLCLCASCHARVEEDPYEHTKLYSSIWGEGMAELLSQLKHQPYKPIGGWKEFEKEAAAHYRKEFERMRNLRLDGDIGRIEFEGFI